jgi:hypothetical protein
MLDFQGFCTTCCNVPKTFLVLIFFGENKAGNKASLCRKIRGRAVPEYLTKAVALGSACESWWDPRDVDANEERECARLRRHSASNGKFAALAQPHAHAAGAALLRMPIAGMRLRMRAHLEIA